MNNPFEEAMTNDKRIEYMAQYACTKGFTYMAKPEEIFNKFAEFKRLIKRGSFTLVQLEDSICERYGVVSPKKGMQLTFLEKEPIMGVKNEKETEEVK